MAVNRINIDEFIRLSSQYPIIDVRSPKEYSHAHFPGAHSIPLFTDEERKVVGTTYKKQSRENAIKVGLDYYGPKMKSILLEVESILHQRDQRTVLVHCWRGGMRSGAIAWLLDLYGFKVYTLEGGYKRFRNWVLEQFSKNYKLRILGGYTGSGKTEILQAMQKRGEAVIDLEKLAEHKGSAYGNLDHHYQHGTEHFENKLALRLFELSHTHPEKTIWLESESSRIGLINIPHQFFEQMKDAERINIEVPFDKRLDFIVEGYGQYDHTALIEATQRIKKRLGGLRMQQVIEFIEENQLKEAFKILLDYYDKAYATSQKKYHEPHLTIQLPDTHPETNTDLILKKTDFLTESR